MKPVSDVLKREKNNGENWSRNTCLYTGALIDSYFLDRGYVGLLDSGPMSVLIITVMGIISYLPNPVFLVLLP